MRADAVGLGWRDGFTAALFADQGAVDCLELTAEHVLELTAEQGELIDLLGRHWPLLVHGLDLSLGSADGPDRRHLDRLAGLVDRVRPPWWSEHLAFTRAGGRRLGHLAPLAPTRESVAIVARNAAIVRRAVGSLPLLENIACPLEPPGDFDEPAFLRAVSDATGCGLLLDVSNAWLGCANRGEEFAAWLDRFPCERVMQLHVAGFRAIDGLLIDTHADPIAEPVHAAVRLVRERCRPRAVILERDEDPPPWAELRRELDRLR